MGKIQITRQLPYPVEMVWNTLVDPNQMEQWLMPNDFRAEVGHQFEFCTKPGPGFDGIVKCEVLEIIHNKKLELSWRGGGIDTIVAFNLEPEGAGTTLHFTQDGFRTRNVLPYFFLSMGWKSIIAKKLPASIERSSSEAA